jgi:hypothetical protein
MINQMFTNIDSDWDSSFLRHCLNRLYTRVRIAVIHGGNKVRLFTKLIIHVQQKLTNL